MIQMLDINEIIPAPYNPRIIEDKDKVNLQNSIKELGIIMPILVNSSNYITIAGHQRTNAMKVLGYKEVPIIFVKDISIGDEMKLNQLHNGIDKEPINKASISVIFEDEGFKKVSPNNANVPESSPVYVREICQLLIKYGNILSCVVCDGEVLMGSNYVKACKLLNMEINCYILSKDKKEVAKKYLSSEYGKYSYSHLEKNTYMQGLAQLHRNPTRDDGKKAFKSQLYENKVIPYLEENPDSSVLDFGAGKLAYVKLLEDMYDIIGLEFFNNNGQTLDIDKGFLLVDQFIDKISKIKQFDTIVCDSVLNSVDSHEAEHHILTCLNLFCKMGGKLFISGRSLEHMYRDTNYKIDITTGKRFIEFVDHGGLTANYRKGKWYYQKYHTKESIRKSLEAHGFEINNEKWSRTFMIEATKTSELSNNEYVDSVKFEFNLPLPDDKSFNKHDDVLIALGLKEDSQIYNIGDKIAYSELYWIGDFMYSEIIGQPYELSEEDELVVGIYKIKNTNTIVHIDEEQRIIEMYDENDED